MLYYLTYTARHLTYQGLSKLVHEQLSPKFGDESMPTIAEQIERIGIKKGIQEGMERGMEEKQRLMICKLLTKGLAAANIAHLLDLSEEMVLKIGKQDKH